MVRPPTKIEPFQLPLMNFEANSIEKMIKWKFQKINTLPGWTGGPIQQVWYQTWTLGYKGVQTKLKVTMPPLIAAMTREEIEGIKLEPLRFDYPCHNQVIEHSVALATVACKRARTEETQNQAVLQIDAGRRSQKNKKVTLAHWGKDYGKFDK